MNCRLAGLLPIACALLALLGGDASADVPAGPRLAFVRTGDRRVELLSADPAAEERRLIAGGTDQARPLPFPFSPPAWSGDGTRIVFAGLSRAQSKGPTDLYEAGADGTDLVKLPHTAGGFDPVSSPDGRTLAFALERQRQRRLPHKGEATVFEGVSTWLLDLESGSVRRITPWQNELFEFPSSFSSDGNTLAISLSLKRHDRRSRYSALALSLHGLGATLLADNAAEPVYSPDGTRVAVIAVGKTRTSKSPKGSTTITFTDLAVANADGSGLKKLTHTKAIELEPSWDPSGRRLAYTQLRASPGESALLGFGDSIMEINSDGSCRTRVLSYSNAILYGAVWQPGPGREAGPITC